MFNTIFCEGFKHVVYITVLRILRICAINRLRYTINGSPILLLYSITTDCIVLTAVNLTMTGIEKHEHEIMEHEIMEHEIMGQTEHEI